MRDSDRAEFAAVLASMAEIHRVEITDAAAELWFAALKHWPLEKFREAAMHLVLECRYMPKPYDFEQLRKAGQLTAGEAWRAVLEGADIDPTSRAGRAAAIVGGQYAIRHADTVRDLPHIQRRFCEAYDELAEVDLVRKALPSIAKTNPLLELVDGAVPRIVDRQRRIGST